MTTDSVLVVAAGIFAASDYQNYNVYICSPTQAFNFRPTSHMAFYAHGKIKRIVPAIRGQVKSITLSEEAVQKCDELDTQTRNLLLYLVDQLNLNNDYRYNAQEYKVIFLSGKGDPDTIFLDHEIENDLVSKKTEKKISFTYGHRYISKDKLLTAPQTTSNLLDVATNHIYHQRFKQKSR